MAEVVRTRFLREFQKNLYPDNEFYTKSRSDSGADSSVSIEIPQAGTAITSTFGAIQAGQGNLDTANALAVKVRQNTKKSYNIEVFGTDPVALQLSDLDTISYQKRSELFQEHQDVIATDIANYAAVQFATNTENTSYIVSTTGTEARSGIVTGGRLGNVRRITKEDIIKVKKIFKTMNLGSNVSGRSYALITPEQWEDLLLIKDFVDYDKTGQESKLKEGMVGRLLGFEFMVRNNEALNANVAYLPDGTKSAYGATLTGEEVSGAIFWHSNFVRVARGRGKLYERRNDPVYKSDIMSADSRFGATQSRTDGKGIVTLIEAVAA